MAWAPNHLSISTVQLALESPIEERRKKVVHLSFPDQAKEHWVPLETHMELVKLVGLPHGVTENRGLIFLLRVLPLLLPPEPYSVLSYTCRAESKVSYTQPLIR